jgi:5-oxoprolinase (ATP-hydrolysing)
MQFLQPIEVSMLSERRVRSPYGLAGGEDGACGLNIHVKRSTASSNAGKAAERRINIGGKATVAFDTNDRLIINTPGGGGWGVPGSADPVTQVNERILWEARGSLAERASAEAAFGA